MSTEVVCVDPMSNFLFPVFQCVSALVKSERAYILAFVLVNALVLNIYI